jgi:hypothetical protein
LYRKIKERAFQALDTTHAIGLPRNLQNRESKMPAFPVIEARQEN